MTRIAAIDLGANTVRIIVAEPDGDPFATLYSDQIITRLSEGLGKNGKLSAQAMKRTVAGVATLLKRAKSFRPFSLVIAAASAGRDAANAHDLDDLLHRATGHGLTIIRWESEARLALKGARLAIRGDRDFVLFDIGGGSTEFIHHKGGGNAPPDMVGTDLGVVRLSETYLTSNPVIDYEYRRLYAEVEKKVDEVFGKLKLPEGTAIVGTAGTVTSLAAMDLELEEYNPGMINNHKLAWKKLDAMRLRLGAMTTKDMSRIGPLKGGREDLIMAGIAIVQAVMKRAGVDHIIVSDYGLREGLALEILEYGTIL